MADEASEGALGGEILPPDPRLDVALLEFATEFVLFTDDRGGIVSGAGAGLQNMGSVGDQSELRLGRHIGEQLHPDDLPKILALIERARADPEFEETVDARAKGLDGRWRRFRSTVTGVRDHPVLGRGAVIRSEILDDHRAEEPDAFLSLAQELDAGVLSADRRGWVVYSNPAAQRLFGLPADDLAGHGWVERVQRADLEEVSEALTQVIRRGRAEQVVFRIATPERRLWLSMRAEPLAPLDRPSGWVAVFEDITGRERARSRLAHRATHDPLTELPNRALLEDRLGHVLLRDQGSDRRVAVFFCDLDRFKDVNDRLGHGAGDAVLREVGRRLRRAIRPSDTVGRLSGDEFVVLAEGLDEEDAELLARRIEATLDGPIELTDRPDEVVDLGISVGFSLVEADGRTAEAVFDAADAEMYRAKQRKQG